MEAAAAALREMGFQDQRPVSPQDQSSPSTEQEEGYAQTVAAPGPPSGPPPPPTRAHDEDDVQFANCDFSSRYVETGKIKERQIA